MDGNWKNDISGWIKDNRRKKQCHNNRLRDNGKFIASVICDKLERSVESDVFREEIKMDISYKGERWNGTYDTDIVYETDIISVYIVFPLADSNGNLIKNPEYRDDCKYYRKRVLVYMNQNTRRPSVSDYIILSSSKSVKEHFNLNDVQFDYFKRMSLSYKGRKTGRTIKLNVDEAIEFRNKVNTDEFFTAEAFMYGKPLPDWKKWTYFGDGRKRKESRRKYYQRISNRCERRNVKKWVREFEDTEFEGKPIKTNIISKSIERVMEDDGRC